MNDEPKLKNRLKEIRTQKKLSQAQLAELVGTTRQTILAVEKEIFNPTARLALLLCIALDCKFEDIFYF
jgi:putative transcriptional regulator